MKNSTKTKKTAPQPAAEPTQPLDDGTFTARLIYSNDIEPMSDMLRDAHEAAADLYVIACELAESLAERAPAVRTSVPDEDMKRLDGYYIESQERLAAKALRNLLDSLRTLQTCHVDRLADAYRADKEKRRQGAA